MPRSHKDHKHKYKDEQDKSPPPNKRRYIFHARNRSHLWYAHERATLLAAVTRTTQLTNLRQQTDDDTPTPRVATDPTHWTVEEIVPQLCEPPNLNVAQHVQWTLKFINSKPQLT